VVEKPVIVLVSGGSSGIGKAICDKFLYEKAVVINADSQAPLKNSSAHFIPCDLTKDEDIKHLYEKMEDEFGIPNILILNAGIGIHEKLSEGDPKKWQDVFNVNTFGALRLIRAFIPQMINKGHGDVFFISSISAYFPYNFGAIYSASKSALSTIAKTLQKEVKGILRVMIVYPGVVDTPFFDRLKDNEVSVDKIGIGAISPDDIANMVYFLHQLPKEIYVPEVSVLPIQQVM